MSILKKIYEYKIDFVNKQKKLHTQSDILNKLKDMPSHDFSFSKKLKIHENQCQNGSQKCTQNRHLGAQESNF